MDPVGESHGLESLANATDMTFHRVVPRILTFNGLGPH